MIQYIQYILIISYGKVHAEIEHLNDLRILPEKTIYHGSCSIRCDRISYVNMTQYPDLICPIWDCISSGRPFLEQNLLSFTADSTN